VPRSLWLDSAEAPAPCAPLDGQAEADLVVVGGGLSGLWAAIHAKEDDPRRDVMLLEADRIACGATGHSGGFFHSSLTHGAGNGETRFPDELPVLERLGRGNFDETVAFLERHGVDCALELTGEMTVALEPHQEEWLAEEAGLLRRLAHDVVLLDAETVQAQVRSPLFHAGLWLRSGAGILDPARLAWGLGRVARELGVRLHEGTRVTDLRTAGAGLRVSTTTGEVRAAGALLTTGAFRSPLRPVRRRIVPVWDYVLATEPLGPARRGSLGWARRQGLSDAANQFHYYRLTSDDRIVWGGYDAVYNYGNGVGPQLQQRDATFGRLAQHFFTTFPQLEGVRFTHRWGGPIDTCSRFFAFFGTSHGGRVAYAAGHTGLGIGASRFGARVALDLLDGRRTEATRLRYARTRPLPFPPEPLRSAVIALTRNRLAAADRRQGRRGVWLRLLDRLGLGFDS
jgi:glycine/D-amino acid oxidase-like deaminating enzyme